MAVDERKYDREAFEQLCARLDAGEQLSFEGIGDVFLKQFWIMMLYTLLDAQDAAKAIQSAMLAVKVEARRMEAEAKASATVPHIEVTDASA